LINNKKKIVFSINYITNFKPNFINSSKNLTFFNKDTNKIILNKSFFLFLISIRFLRRKSFFNKNTLFVKKYKKNIQTLLRPPYRHKLSRHQLILNRYYIVHNMEYFFYDFLYLNNFSELLYLIKNFKHFCL
jgi:hypothetical protein